MASPFATPRGGSLLLRTLAVGGLATAAWLVCAGVASAAEDHPDELAQTLDTVNVTLGEQEATTADLLADAVPQRVVPFLSITTAPQPSGSPLIGSPSIGSPSVSVIEVFAVDFTATGVLTRPSTAMPDPSGDRYPFPDVSYSGPYSSADPYSGTDAYSGSDGYGSYGYSAGYSHSGTVSNTMPTPMYEAKVAAKAAARAAAQSPAPAVPPAPVEVAPARVDVLPFAPRPTQASPAASQITPNTEVVWEVPGPSAPAPTPKQAPAPSAPTASSGSADSGGGHRGGLLASLTGQSNPKPLTAWSAERGDDGRSPGSIPGLPSTSPD
ncbi:hypothetical protein AB0K14_18380 [Actinosynnema sp. NPDC050801]|uniref:hypothetical protein n=1 Tax=unclassified Actinosynnema TaxID=2637065 RepID=UPI0033E6755A